MSNNRKSTKGRIVQRVQDFLRDHKGHLIKDKDKNPIPLMRNGAFRYKFITHTL